MKRNLKQDVAEVISTAWPLMLSTGLFSVTLFVDRKLLYNHGAGSAGAAMVAGVLSWALTCLPMGVCGFTSTFVAQYLAAKRPDRAMQFVWQGVFIALSVLPLLVLFGVFAHSFFLLSGHTESAARQEAEYFQWLIPGASATVVSAALIGLYAGSGRTRVLLISDIAATFLNVILDYLLIFGLFGFPEWGAKGAALASSISLTLKLVVLIWFARPDFRHGMVRARDSQTGRLDTFSEVDKAKLSERGERASVCSWFASRFQWPLMKRLIDYGWPAGVSVVAEAWSFLIIMMMVGQLGKEASDATTLALGVNLIAFIPLVGLGTAVGVLVGKYLVEGRKEVAKRIVFSGLLVGVAYSLIFVILYGGFPDLAMTVYSFDVEPERFEPMRPVLRPLLYFIAGYCLFDALQTVYVGALKGAGDTYYVLGGHVFAGSVTVLGGLLVRHLTNWNHLYYWWSVVTVWVILLAMIFTGRYLQGGWQSKRVIEPEVIEETKVAEFSPNAKL